MNRETVVVALYPGCISFEVALAAELLSKKYQIINATPDGLDIADSTGLPLKAQMSYSEVSLDACRAILVPGGNPDSIVHNKEIDRILIEACDRGLLIAGICAGPSVLAKAGILRGKKIAHGYRPEQFEFLAEVFRDVTLTDSLFVADGIILTAKPEAHIEFAVEIACRLGAADASKANRIKDYYRGILGRRIRPLALALIRNSKGQFLFHKGHDRVKGENFYRPLGGGIEFSESGQVAIEREIMEELNQEVVVSGLTACFENVFTFEGQKGHEIVMLFSADFKNKTAYEPVELEIFESGVAIAKAVWRSVAEIKTEGAQLYPTGLEEVLNGR